MTNGHLNTHKRPSRFGEMHRRAKHVGRIIAFLTREQLDFVDKISKDALFSTGKKLPRSEVIQAMVEAVRKQGISGNLVHNQDELVQRINELAKSALPDLAKELKKFKEENKEKEGVKNETD